jgi:hypothetical protein
MNQQYYFDSLPLRKQPKQLESFTSYLTRLAEMNGIHTISGLQTVSFPDQSREVVRNLKDYPLPEMRRLETIATCSEDDLLGTTFYHLGKKFGRSLLPRSLPAFLSDSLAGNLRFCPVCIADQGYYSLAWRFPLLQGCHKHSCIFVDSCTYCDQSVPFIGPSLRIGICSNCKSDLRRCVPQKMNGEESDIAEETFRELDFLLSSQTWENDASSIHIGAYFTSLRQKEHLTMEAIAKYLKKDIRAVMSVEHALVEIGGTSFQSYSDYARLLDIKLSDIFNNVLSGAADRMSSGQRDMLSEGELIEKIKSAAVVLWSRGEYVTKAALSSIAEIPLYQLFKYSSTKACFEQLVRHNKSEVRKALIPSRKVFEDVQRAIAYLEEIGEPPTTQRVRKLVGVDNTYFRDHPHINLLLKESMKKYRAFYYLKRNQEREEELILKVEFAIQELEASHHPVTRRAIGSIIGKKPEKLMIYPRLEALLQQRVNWPQRRQEQVSSHEEDLLMRVEMALQQLEALGKTKTLRAIGQLVGLSASSLHSYPSVRDLLMQRIDAYRKRYGPLVSEQEKHLLMKVVEAIELLEKKGYPVTQRAVSRLTGITVQKIMKHSRIRSLFERRAEQQFEYQAIQRNQREEELLVKVEEAIELLKKLDQPITQQSLGDIVGKNLDTLRTFVRVRKLLIQYPKSQQLYSKATARTYEDKYTEKIRKIRQREEELLTLIKTLLEQLENTQQTITIKSLSSNFARTRRVLLLGQNGRGHHHHP